MLVNIIYMFYVKNNILEDGYRAKFYAARSKTERRIQNPWAGGRMAVDAFWIAGGRRHCSEFVLGLFCSISHGSTLRHKGWTNPTIHSQVFVFVLARGGCGRGASALPLNASEAR